MVKEIPEDWTPGHKYSYGIKLTGQEVFLIKKGLEELKEKWTYPDMLQAVDDLLNRVDKVDQRYQKLSKSPL